MATRAKPPTQKPPAKKRTPARKVATKAAGVSQSQLLDKALDLIKWVDSPMKLFNVVVLSSLFFIGWVTWDSRHIIIHAVTTSHKMPTLEETDKIAPVAQKLMADTEATIVVVNSANLVINSRTTVLAMSRTGRESSIEGTQSSLFNQAPQRNRAVIAMLAGEVICEPFEASSKVGEWGQRLGVTFMCRGSIPPEVGAFAGYVSVGFREQPRDLQAVKSIINQASSRMSR